MPVIDRPRTKGGLDTGSRSNEYAGWWCLSIEPYICCGGCGFIECYVSDDRHLIIVWEERDEDTLLKLAGEHKKRGFDVRVVEFRADFGMCVPWEEVESFSLPDGRVLRPG